jgi:ribosomal 30S subunit maturation factor RimM
MTDMWVYRVEVFVPKEGEQTTPDLAGFEVVTTDDQKIGKVDEATNDARGSWIVVDTGFWIFGKKRMIPAGAIESVDLDERRLRVALSKEEVKNAPDYDKAREFQDSYRKEMDNYYGKRPADSAR